MMKKEEIILYNINKKEENKIKHIFKNLNISVKFRNTQDEEDFFSYPTWMAFIKLPNNDEKLNSIKEKMEILRGWQIFFIVNDNFFANIKKIQENIKESFEDIKNKIVDRSIKDGIIGFAVGDALGVPAEFKTRETLKRYPITDMIGYGTYNVPKGTWSDDTSMTLATIDSLNTIGKIDTNDMANRFLDWYRNSNYTATEETFDIGRTTMQSLQKYELGINNTEDCGQFGEKDNGNGSLMRMLPIAFYIHSIQTYDLEKNENIKATDKKIYDMVKKVSMITHSHEISILGCYIFVRFAMEIMDGKFKDLSYEYIKNLDYSFFSPNSVDKYYRILKEDIKYKSVNDIKSTGYIVDTLEAVLWLFLNSKDYNSTILKAVNLGGDTDTIAAITGGLLGLYYGIDKINNKWKKDLKKFDYISNFCDKFYDTYRLDLDKLLYLMDSKYTSE